MRIISGKFKKKKLLLPDPKITRPLRDFVKENIFNLLAHSQLLKFNFNTSTVLDFFSGSGSFGIECISRGTSEVIFVEREQHSLNILYQNIKNLVLQDKCKIINQDVLKLDLEKFLKPSVDIIFLDPPYDYKHLDDLFNLLQKNLEKLKKTIIIIHFESTNMFNFDNYLNIIIKKKYGRSMIIFGKFSN
jgi:16S rRNA (guanine966-N2)-methyltransferase